VLQLDPLERLRFQRGVENLHGLGPRATAEFIVEIADRIGGLPAVLRVLAEYECRLTPAMLAAIAAPVAFGAAMSAPSDWGRVS
jgi:hypothetical protein